MKITLELDVVPHVGGGHVRFSRAVTWETVPRVGDRIELADGWASWPVERVTFTARGTARVQLKTLEDDHHDVLTDLRTHEKSRWKEEEE